jgi:predicted dehydrogenase
MSKPIRFGFIGAGAIAASSADSINRHPLGRVVAVQDTHEGRTRELCEAHQIPKAYKTAAELFADKEVDAVYIAVPNKFHVPLTLDALKAGKHVILEKPFAMNATEAGLAVEAARKVGKVLTLGMNQRFAEMPQRFRTLVKKGTFGEIYHAKACWLRRSGIPSLGTWFGNRELAGGGCLYDIGVHLLDLCLYVIDNFEPVSVYGSTYTKFGNRGLGGGSWGKSDKEGLPFDVEDFATGQIRLADGTSVSLDVTWARHAADNDKVEIDLFGTEAGGSVMAGKLYKWDEQAKAHIVVDQPPAAIAYTHRDRFHNFINHLTGSEELCVTLEQAVTVQRILDALAESSTTGHSVRL